MRLSEDVLREAVKSVRYERFEPIFQIGRQPSPVSLPPRAVLAARAKVRPFSDGARHRAWSVSLRSVTATGVVFVDSNYWMDGERFILQLPKVSKISAMLCTITYWQPLASDLFVVSASFVRAMQAPKEHIPGRGDRRRHPTEL
jgi:hypothetical protein